MTKPTGNPRGRPAVPEGERKATKPYRLEPALVARLERVIAKGKRGAFVRDAVREKLDREHPEG